MLICLFLFFCSSRVYVSQFCRPVPCAMAIATKSNFINISFYVGVFDVNHFAIVSFFVHYCEILFAFYPQSGKNKMK